MKALIFSMNKSLAAYLQRNIVHEGLGCEIVYSDKPETGQFDAVDGAFVVWDENSTICDLIDLINLRKPQLPIIVLSAKQLEELDNLQKSMRIECYFVDPYPFRQIVSEMRFAVFRQREIIDTKRYLLREIELDVARHQVKIKSKTVYLRNKEFSLLHFMMANRGKVLTRPVILENVWDRNVNIITNTVDVHISQLRRKIKMESQEKYIFTVPCMGYMLQ